MTIDGSKLRCFLSQRKIQVSELAIASQIAASALSAIINGYERIGVVRAARLTQGLRSLGLSSAEIQTLLGKDAS
jgi:plasmid maintenance system antidote protein VapI